MAKQIGLLCFTGKLGNLIGYRRNGEYFVRTMPEQVRQTAATQQAARNFGIASRKGKLVRHSILPHLDLHHNGSLVNRLNKVLLRANGNIPRSLEGFRINSYAGAAQFFCGQPVVTAQGIVKIPAQTLPPQGNATHLEIKLVSVRINFQEQQVTGSSTASTRISLHQPFGGIALEALPPGKGTLLLVLQIRSFNGDMAIQDRRFSAADIIAVTTPSATKPKRAKTNNIPQVSRLLSSRTQTLQATTKRPVAIKQRE